MKTMNSKGYSLIELLAVLGILAIVITSIMSFFIMNTKASKTAQEQLELQHQLQTAVVAVSERLQNAHGIDYTYFDGVATYNIKLDNDLDGVIDQTQSLVFVEASGEIILNGTVICEYISGLMIKPTNAAGAEVDTSTSTNAQISALLSSSKLLLLNINAQVGSSTKSTSTSVYKRNN